MKNKWGCVKMKYKRTKTSIKNAAARRRVDHFNSLMNLYKYVVYCYTINRFVQSRISSPSHSLF